MDLNDHALADLAFGLAAEATPPADLRARVLGAASTGADARTGVAWRDGAPAAALVAFTRTAGELVELLTALDDVAWTLPAPGSDGTVRDLVAHLVGVDRYVLGQLGRGPALDAPTRDHHAPVARELAGAVDAMDAPSLVRAWWLGVTELLRACGSADPAEPVGFHHLALSVRGLLVVRTFELWTHGEQIRAATGRFPDDLDRDRLHLMSSELVGALALGMELQGTARPGRRARIVLTGPGGGRYDVALGPGAETGDRVATITLSTLDLCRVAARQRGPHDIAVEISGDASLLEPVLVGAQAFAAD